jgi:hypothetical protein
MSYSSSTALTSFKLTVSSWWAINGDGVVCTGFSLETAVESSQELEWAKDFDLRLSRFQNILEVNDCACDLQTYVIVNESTSYIIMNNIVLAESASHRPPTLISVSKFSNARHLSKFLKVLDR